LGNKFGLEKYRHKILLNIEELYKKFLDVSLSETTLRIFASLKNDIDKLIYILDNPKETFVG
jgi:hypothetical protein